MNLGELPVVAAVGLGILTSVSPCPMASHAAAVSVLVRQAGGARRGLVVGSAFAFGRSTTYVVVAGLASLGLQGLGPLVRRIQSNAEPVMGIVFLVGGILLALSPWIRWAGVGIDGQRWKDRFGPLGAIPGAFGLGMVMAWAFCPVSAGIFFGSVVPLAAVTEPWLLVVVPYGFATALPVLALTVAAGFGTSWIARLFDATRKVAVWLHRISAGGMVVAGIWMLARWLL
ncbi:MAG TPA: sulfite exporter TauE/SafE family protein [Fibrobacteria bacterium]|nr:sulfite exporter TauE/SafE family protein [Fibrobacteria bacterium]